MATNKIPWPGTSNFEAYVSRGLVYYRLRGTAIWSHLDHVDSNKVRNVYVFANE